MTLYIPPSEWGFVPFASGEEYPSLPAENAQQQSGKAGRRAQRTMLRRQQRLQELIDGTIWPTQTGSGEKIRRANINVLE